MASLRAVIAFSILLMGCNPGTPQSVDGVMLLRWGQLEAAPLGIGDGRLTFLGGCVGLERADQPTMVLWPPNTALDSSTGALRLIAGNAHFAEGDLISIGGGEVGEQQAKALVGPIPAACSRDKYLLAAEIVLK